MRPCSSIHPFRGHNLKQHLIGRSPAAALQVTATRAMPLYLLLFWGAPRRSLSTSPRQEHTVEGCRKGHEAAVARFILARSAALSCCPHWQECQDVAPVSSWRLPAEKFANLHISASSSTTSGIPRPCVRDMPVGRFLAGRRCQRQITNRESGFGCALTRSMFCRMRGSKPRWHRHSGGTQRGGPCTAGRETMAAR